ncbi:Short-chain dehydrogenase/reductase SDR [Penicillium robsamsonii]|uniref:Short-chain dehydrogenase/reductase SDR n=1 Tax=Penicillium robsamsonii TaxID=1792511 RepID=UPI0025466664|nr:Short-chain dehydrogenase/reductase SDR [Penicillium robsamsonii]KAJ5823085.1 Short-chain dehydrogenase/reductase SDR [Penicillium robsamsonii]
MGARLGDYGSVTSFVRRLQLFSIYIDFALLDPGVANFNYTQTPSTSHGLSIQIYWLSTALLTLLLFPMLNKQDAANPTHPRPVTSIVSSETATWAKFKVRVSTTNGTPLIKVLDDKTHFDMGDRYYTLKLLCQLFFLELIRSGRSFLV